MNFEVRALTTSTCVTELTTDSRPLRFGEDSGFILHGEHGRWQLTTQVLEVSLKEARQIAVTSQLLSDEGTTASPQDVLSHLGAIQLDAMQRVDKSHRLVCFSRLAAL